MPKYNGCKGKVRHTELLSAQIAARKTGNAQILPYKCGVCKGYHIGRSSNPWFKEKRLDQLFRKIQQDNERRNKPL